MCLLILKVLCKNPHSVNVFLAKSDRPYWPRANFLNENAREKLLQICQCAAQEGSGACGLERRRFASVAPQITGRGFTHLKKSHGWCWEEEFYVRTAEWCMPKSKLCGQVLTFSKLHPKTKRWVQVTFVASHCHQKCHLGNKLHNKVRLFWYFCWKVNPKRDSQQQNNGNAARCLSVTIAQLIAPTTAEPRDCRQDNTGLLTFSWRCYWKQ